MATKLYQMRQFCKDVVHTAACGSHDPTAKGMRFVSCRTYEAFADALHCCLEELTEDVRKIERSVVEHCESL